MDNRRLLLAVILSMGVLFAWSYFFAPRPSPRTETDQADRAAVMEDAAAPPSAAALDEEAPPPGGDRAGELAAEEPPALSGNQDEERPLVEAAAAQTIRIVTDLAEIELSNRGAQLIHYRLVDYRETKDGEVMDLVRQHGNDLYPFGLTNLDGTSSALNDVLFAVEQPTPDEVVFRYSGSAGAAEKHFVFQEGGLIEVTARVTGNEFGLFLGPGVRNPPQAETNGPRFLRRAVYLSGDDFKGLSASKVKETEDLPAGGLRWVGLDDNYFLTAVIPETPLRRLSVDPVLLNTTAEGELESWTRVLPGEQIPEERRKEKHGLAVRIEPLGDEIAVLSYWGPKNYDYLASFGLDLEKTVNLGFFRPLARLFMKALQWIHANVVHNYGWAIILMTIGIKIVLLPITLKHAGSMRKMQALNPKVQAVRNRYQGKLKDKQGRPNLEAQRKMNEEVMATYREAGVNPAGGCLPMILQIPVFFAFYKLLYESIELRHAPWEMWITDLSAKDPYFILPIVMGATQVLQQRLMPMPSGNPLQRRMMAMMPIVFTFFFLQFPAGLVLYWLTNNVTTIIQQTVYNRLRNQDEDGGDQSSTAGKPRRKAKA